LRTCISALPSKLLLNNFLSVFGASVGLNSFEKEYAVESALFHWLLDESILYNKFETNNVIEFRYTV
jgi:hypothetical protein